MIQINGKTYSGNNVSIRNRTVVIDGIVVDSGLSDVVEIRITEGSIHNLQTDASVKCTNVTGDVKASGSVTCVNVQGSVTASGSVVANSVKGGVKAGGSVVIG